MYLCVLIMLFVMFIIWCVFVIVYENGCCLGFTYIVVHLQWMWMTCLRCILIKLYVFIVYIDSCVFLFLCDQEFKCIIFCSSCCLTFKYMIAFYNEYVTCEYVFWNVREFSLLIFGAWCLYYVCVFKTCLCVMTNIWYVMFNVWCLCIYNSFCDVHNLMCVCDCVWKWLLFGLYLHSCAFTMNVDDMFDMWFDQVVYYVCVWWPIFDM